MKKLTTILAAVVAVLSIAVSPDASAAQRQVTTLTDGWTIKPITQTAKGYVGESVTLPHTWNTWYVGDTLWYNREMMVYEHSLELTPELKGKRLYLYFEGANSVADLFINRCNAGTHKGGYTACCFEITDLLKDGRNLIEVWVSNAYRTDVLPISGDFNVCGGLHRPCHLIVTEKDCISPLFYASPGLLIRQEQVSREQASFTAETIVSVSGAPYEYSIETVVSDASGNEVARTRKALDQTSMSVDEKGLIHAGISFKLDKPHLWNGKKDPYLYTVTSSLYKGSVLMDSVSEQTGFRFFKVDPDRGFFLNGEYLDLVGACRHEDVAGKGSALTEEDYERDFELIRELGATGMRLAHYPHAEPVYRHADKDGIVLMTEIPLCGPGGYGYTGYLDSVKENAREQLREFVYQKFNHPSIIFWGIFNEILVDEGRFEAYDDPIPFLKELNELYHQCDPSRLTTFATCVEQSHYIDCADLIAWNKYYGWYSDGYKGASTFFDQARAESHGKPVGVSEYGAAASIKHHQWPLDKSYLEKFPSGRIHPEEAQAVCHEGNWEAFSERPWLWCKFVWVFADFPSTIRHEGDTDGINDKGLLTRDRQNRKDAFYFYKANWNPEPMIHINSSRYTVRDKGVTDVRVYTNLPSATLYVNGKSLGTVKKDRINRIVWEGVKLSVGENLIEVKGKNGKEIISDSCTWAYMPATAVDPASAAGTVIPANPQTLTKALAQAAKTLAKGKDVTIELAGGTYELSEPIVLDMKYSGRGGAGLLFRAKAGEVPVISGGRRVTGWTRVNGNLYSAHLDCDHKVRTMLVDGKRALMAQASVRADGAGVAQRFPITGQESWAFGQGEGVESIAIRDGEQLAAFRNPEDVEMVQSKTWTEKILCLSDMEKMPDGSYRAHLQQPLGAIINSMAWAGKIDYRGKFHFRNAFELLDEPNEFYFDRSTQTIYYMTDGRDANDMEIVVPRSEGLVRIHGRSNDERVSNIAFEGITFAYDAWNLAELEGSRGFGGIQSLGLAGKYIPDGNWHPTKYNSCMVPEGCIDVKNASGIRIERCRFEHLGCASAICMTNDVQYSSIVGNVFMDILGNALTIGHPQHYEIGDGEGTFPAGVEGLCHDILIGNNYLRNVCLDFRQVETMVAFFVRDVRFLYNDIQYCPYGAIALGWWWGNAGIPESTVAGHNAVSFNRIGNTHQLLSDGGPIYLLGRQPESEIEGNYVFSSPRCIYPDDGSSGWDIHDNFVNVTYKAWLHIASDRDYDIKVHDNLVKDNFLINDGVGVVVKNTENFRNRPFSQRCYDIMDASGIQDAYKDIIPEKEPEIIRIAPDFNIEKW